MTKELFNKAGELDTEIGRLNTLIDYIENSDQNDIKYNDSAYLVHLLGVEDSLRILRTRKRMLEKEFEEL